MRLTLERKWVLCSSVFVEKNKTKNTNLACLQMTLLVKTVTLLHVNR